ncbi:hypothetical protein TNCV_1404391 [Trichonephila clavipes]|nr:hypothetical protein TNCV_1404391 [Trichonephila clavipes]
MARVRTSPATRTDAHQQKEHPARTYLKAALPEIQRRRTLCEQLALLVSCPNSQSGISNFVPYFVLSSLWQVKAVCHFVPTSVRCLGFGT